MSKAEKYSSLMGSLTSVELFKRNQGKWVRQITFWFILVVLFCGAWVASQQLIPASWEWPDSWRYGFAFALLAPIAWFAFRVIHYPKFADFLIAVEAEMAKVSWPKKDELKRSTVVVIVTMVLLSTYLLFCDLFWQQVLQVLGVR